MSRRKRKREQTIFFPWERRRGLLQMPWLRSRPMMFGAGFAVVALMLGISGQSRLGKRSTRASLLVVRDGLDAYRADNEMRCPGHLAQLQDEGYIPIKPIDAWGRTFHLTCPGRRNPESYDLVSYGATGDMRGLDRIE